ncbi:MAG: aminotransferase class I/II-fold pyridoxal phosphate-dependent enzyme [Clostridia bacterium]|nr:aminotransferase class I/II-fold pyridoxal phosphate-dependent enzyme [Clostridia bacterium]
MKTAKAQRLNHFQTGIFASLDDKKNELVKMGRTIYNLSIGTPDFKPHPSVMKAVSEACLDAENFKYALTEIDELTETLIHYYKDRFSVEICKEEITAVHGSQEGIGHIGLALCNKGDVVLLPDPGYPIFEVGAYFGEAEMHFYPLLEKNNYLPCLKELDEDVLKRTKFIILSYPSNPVGAVATRQMYMEVIELAKKYGFIIINDNAYSDIIFDGNESFSFLSIPGAKDVGIEFYSLSKSFNITGARISFAIGNKEVIDAFKLLRSQYDFGVFKPVQYGAIAAMKLDRSVVEEQRLQYQKRRDALCGNLRKIGWNVPDSKGTMFVWAPLPKGYNNSVEFCNLLMEKTGVICTPGAAFGKNGEGYVRFALVKDADELEKIVDVIASSGIIK